MQGKVIVAFGAGQGIGRGCALAMASEGASVVAPSVPIFFERQPEGAYEASLAKIPLGRYGDAEADIGHAVAFLASDDAQFVTGQTIMLDGGQVHY